MERFLDNSPEELERRKLVWQFVMPKVVEIKPPPKDNVIDLNANVIYPDFGGGDEAA